ncbi:MAG: c-type cytochrome [Acidobacteria bacterium]|nr:c-type cytochrome [Acidobacteriota bacterium]
MKRLKFCIVSVIAILICACLYCPIFHAMPKFMDRYDADPYSKAEMKGRCSVCHRNEEGFGPLNKFGQTFAKNGYRITVELRQQVPEAFSASTTEAVAVEPQFDAKAFYDRNCVVCHGADGKGGDSGMIVPDFTDSAWQRRNDDQKMIVVISKGKGAMPAFKDKLTEGQIKAMAAFIRTFSDKRGGR